MEYPNSGNLNPNTKRDHPKSPNLWGSIKMERSLLEEMLAEADGETITIELSAWTREYNGKKFLSLVAKKPWKKDGEAPKKKSAPQSDIDDDDIPF